MPVINAQQQLLGLATLRFRWKDAGNLVWDYDARMMRTAPYAELGNRVDLSMTLLALQGIVGAMVLVDAVMSVREAWHALRSLRLKAYLFSPATVLNWTSLAFQGYYVYLWMQLVWRLETLELGAPALYAPAAAPNSEVRWLATDAQAEHKWLLLVSELESVLSQEADCYAVLGLTLMLMLLRVLSACHFQPKWASVTGTLLAMIPDTINYVILYMLVVGGYACVGMMLFGQQVASMSTFGEAMLVLLQFLLTMDPELFEWDAMQQAANIDLAFQLYVWTFVVLGFLILLNVFLCILIEAYMTSKEALEAQMSTTVADDLLSVSHMAYHMLTKPARVFVSDGALADMLRCQTKTEGIPPIVELRETVLQGFKSSVPQTMTVKADAGGVTFSAKEVKTLTRPPEPGKMVGIPMFSGQQTAAGFLSTAIAADAQGSDDESSSSDSESETESLVGDIMTRFNEEESAAEVEENMLDVMKWEAVHRHGALTQHMSWLIPKVSLSPTPPIPLLQA